MNAPPNDIIVRIEGYSGVNLAAAFAIPDLDREIKWHCKYARQNGIHVWTALWVQGQCCRIGDGYECGHVSGLAVRSR